MSFDTDTLKFINNSIITGREDRYVTTTVDLHKVLKSWGQSVFSYEWIRPDGTLKKTESLTDKNQEKVTKIQQALESGEPIERPILGIGIMENVEIGTGQSTIATLAAFNVAVIEVHIPKSNASEFKAYLV